MKLKTKDKIRKLTFWSMKYFKKVEGSIQMEKLPYQIARIINLPLVYKI